jgi:hypothetical protein
MTNAYRIDPLGLLKQPTIETASQKPIQETARQNNTEVGACPVCQKSMQLASVNNSPVYVCMEHCVCLPTAD